MCTVIKHRGVKLMPPNSLVCSSVAMLKSHKMCHVCIIGKPIDSTLIGKAF